MLEPIIPAAPTMVNFSFVKNAIIVISLVLVSSQVSFDQISSFFKEAFSNGITPIALLKLLPPPVGFTISLLDDKNVQFTTTCSYGGESPENMTTPVDKKTETKGESESEEIQTGFNSLFTVLQEQLNLTEVQCQFNLPKIGGTYTPLDIEFFMGHSKFILGNEFAQKINEKFVAWIQKVTGWEVSAIVEQLRDPNSLTKLHDKLNSSYIELLSSLPKVEQYLNTSKNTIEKAVSYLSKFSGFSNSTLFSNLKYLQSLFNQTNESGLYLIRKAQYLSNLTYNNISESLKYFNNMSSWTNESIRYSVQKLRELFNISQYKITFLDDKLDRAILYLKNISNMSTDESLAYLQNALNKTNAVILQSLKILKSYLNQTDNAIKTSFASMKRLSNLTKDDVKNSLIQLQNGLNSTNQVIMSSMLQLRDLLKDSDGAILKSLTFMGVNISKFGNISESFDHLHTLLNSSNEVILDNLRKLQNLLNTSNDQILKSLSYFKNISSFDYDKMMESAKTLNQLVNQTNQGILSNIQQFQKLLNSTDNAFIQSFYYFGKMFNISNDTINSSITKAKEKFNNVNQILQSGLSDLSGNTNHTVMKSIYYIITNRNFSLRETFTKLNTLANATEKVVRDSYAKLKDSLNTTNDAIRSSLALINNMTNLDVEAISQSITKLKQLLSASNQKLIESLTKLQEGLMSTNDTLVNSIIYFANIFNASKETINKSISYIKNKFNSTDSKIIEFITKINQYFSQSNSTIIKSLKYLDNIFKNSNDKDMKEKLENMRINLNTTGTKVIENLEKVRDYLNSSNGSFIESLSQFKNLSNLSQETIVESFEKLQNLINSTTQVIRGGVAGMKDLFNSTDNNIKKFVEFVANVFQIPEDTLNSFVSKVKTGIDSQNEAVLNKLHEFEQQFNKLNMMIVDGIPYFLNLTKSGNFSKNEALNKLKDSLNATQTTVKASLVQLQGLLNSTDTTILGALSYFKNTSNFTYETMVESAKKLQELLNNTNQVILSNIEKLQESFNSTGNSVAQSLLYLGSLFNISNEQINSSLVYVQKMFAEENVKILNSLKFIPTILQNSNNTIIKALQNLNNITKVGNFSLRPALNQLKTALNKTQSTVLSSLIMLQQLLNSSHSSMVDSLSTFKDRTNFTFDKMVESIQQLNEFVNSTNQGILTSLTNLQKLLNATDNEIIGTVYYLGNIFKIPNETIHKSISYIQNKFNETNQKILSSLSYINNYMNSSNSTPIKTLKFIMGIINNKNISINSSLEEYKKLYEQTKTALNATIEKLKELTNATDTMIKKSLSYFNNTSNFTKESMIESAKTLQQLLNETNNNILESLDKHKDILNQTNSTMYQSFIYLADIFGIPESKVLSYVEQAKAQMKNVTQRLQEYLNVTMTNSTILKMFESLYNIRKGGEKISLFNSLELLQDYLNSSDTSIIDAINKFRNTFNSSNNLLLESLKFFSNSSNFTWEDAIESLKKFSKLLNETANGLIASMEKAENLMNSSDETIRTSLLYLSKVTNLSNETITENLDKIKNQILTAHEKIISAIGYVETVFNPLNNNTFIQDLQNFTNVSNYNPETYEALKECLSNISDTKCIRDFISERVAKYYENKTELFLPGFAQGKIKDDFEYSFEKGDTKYTCALKRPPAEFSNKDLSYISFDCTPDKIENDTFQMLGMVLTTDKSDNNLQITDKGFSFDIKIPEYLKNKTKSQTFEKINNKIEFDRGFVNITVSSEKYELFKIILDLATILPCTMEKSDTGDASLKCAYSDKNENKVMVMEHKIIKAKDNTILTALLYQDDNATFFENDNSTSEESSAIEASEDNSTSDDETSNPEEDSNVVLDIHLSFRQLGKFQSDGTTLVFFFFGLTTENIPANDQITLMVNLFNSNGEMTEPQEVTCTVEKPVEVVDGKPVQADYKCELKDLKDEIVSLKLNSSEDIVGIPFDDEIALNPVTTEEAIKREELPDFSLPANQKKIPPVFKFNSLNIDKASTDGIFVLIGVIEGDVPEYLPSFTIPLSQPEGASMTCSLKDKKLECILDKELSSAIVLEQIIVTVGGEEILMIDGFATEEFECKNGLLMKAQKKAEAEISFRQVSHIAPLPGKNGFNFFFAAFVNDKELPANHEITIEVIVLIGGNKVKKDAKCKLEKAAKPFTQGDFNCEVELKPEEKVDIKDPEAMTISPDNEEIGGCSELPKEELSPKATDEAIEETKDQENDLAKVVDFSLEENKKKPPTFKIESLNMEGCDKEGKFKVKGTFSDKIENEMVFDIPFSFPKSKVKCTVEKAEGNEEVEITCKVQKKFTGVKSFLVEPGLIKKKHMEMLYIESNSEIKMNEDKEVECNDFNTIKLEKAKQRKNAKFIFLQLAPPPMVSPAIMFFMALTKKVKTTPFNPITITVTITIEASSRNRLLESTSDSEKELTCKCDSETDTGTSCKMNCGPAADETPSKVEIDSDEISGVPETINVEPNPTPDLTNKEGLEQIDALPVVKINEIDSTDCPSKGKYIIKGDITEGSDKLSDSEGITIPFDYPDSEGVCDLKIVQSNKVEITCDNKEEFTNSQIIIPSQVINNKEGTPLFKITEDFTSPTQFLCTISDNSLRASSGSPGSPSTKSSPSSQNSSTNEKPNEPTDDDLTKQKYYTHNTKNSSTGLSGGAIAGIVIACVVAIAVVGALIAYANKNGKYGNNENKIDKYNNTESIYNLESSHNNPQI